MLRQDVRDAVDEDRFHVWAVENVDQGMEILTGVPMGEPDEDGVYPDGTVNRRVKDRLDAFAERWRELGDGEAGGSP
jgi:predicted ATP-dependent protease